MFEAPTKQLTILPTARMGRQKVDGQKVRAVQDCVAKGKRRGRWCAINAMHPNAYRASTGMSSPAQFRWSPAD